MSAPAGTGQDSGFWRGRRRWPPPGPGPERPTRFRGRDPEADAALYKAVGDMAAAVRWLTPSVLETSVAVLDANGQATKAFRVPFAALAVTSGSLKQLTVTAAAPAAAVPGPGPGAGQVPALGFAAHNLTGYAWTVYGGNPGDVITVSTFGRPIPPNSESGLIAIAPGQFVSIAAGQVIGAVSDYPAGAVPVEVSSGNVANAAATATLPAAVGKTTWLTGFEVTGAGATAALVVAVTVTGPANTLTYIYAAALGVAVENVPLLVQFPKPIPGAAANTAVVVTCPALGAGNTNNAVSAHGYQL